MKRAHGKEQIIPKRGKRGDESSAAYLFIGGGSAQTSSLMLSKTAALAVMFDESLRQFEDYLFFIKAEALGLKFVTINKPLTVWYNDWRHDRLSMHYNKTYTAAEAFINAAQPYITSNPRRAAKDILFGVSTGVFGVSRLFRLLARWLLLPILRRA